MERYHRGLAAPVRCLLPIGISPRVITVALSGLEVHNAPARSLHGPLFLAAVISRRTSIGSSPKPETVIFRGRLCSASAGYQFTVSVTVT